MLLTGPSPRTRSLAHGFAQAARTVAPIDVLVLDAGLRQSLVTVRSLGRRGLAVAAANRTLDVPAFRSRW